MPVGSLQVTSPYAKADITSLPVAFQYRSQNRGRGLSLRFVPSVIVDGANAVVNDSIGVRIFPGVVQSQAGWIANYTRPNVAPFWSGRASGEIDIDLPPGSQADVVIEFWGPTNIPATAPLFVEFNLTERRNV